MSLRSKVIKGAQWTTTSSVVTMALHFFQLALLARLLEPSAFGIMAMIMVVIGFSNVFADMGISNAIIQRENPTANQLSSLYWLNIFAGLSIFLIVILVIPLVVTFYSEPSLPNLLHWASLTFIITPFGQQFQILLQKELKFNRIAKIEILSAFFRTISTILFAYFGFGVLSLVWGQLVGASCKSFILVISSWSTWHPRFHFNKEDLAGYLSFGLYQVGDRSLSFLKSNLDNILIGKFLGPELLGYYTIAFNIIIYPVSKLNPILTKVAFPLFSKIQGQNDRLKSGYFYLLNLLSFVNFPIFLVILVTSDILIPTVFGEEWIPSIILVQILAGVGLLRSVGNPLGSLLLAKGRADLGFKWNFYTIIIQIAGALIGIWLGGLIGLAVAYLVLQLIYFALEYLILIRKLLGKCFKEYISNISLPLFMSVIMAILVIGVDVGINIDNSVFQLSIDVLIGVIVYLLLTYINRDKLNFLKVINPTMWKRR